ncbi:hypothetical protein RB195_025800 [Necator americanus]|uniref:Ras family protein n=1 Tax=Necator americanus TaxID=51031 RepID=A0ABR1ETY4_NECAM
MNFNYSDIMIYPSEAQYAANRFKILVIGRGGSGRSSLLRRFKQNIFHNPKEEISHPEITVVVRAIHGSIVKADLQIIELSSFACNEDVSGPAKVHMAKNFMDVNGVLLVYDTTNVKTFQELCDTLPTLQRMIAPNVDIFLVGTKADLNDQRMVSFDDAEKKSQELGFSLFETSAVTGVNCEELLIEVLDKVAERRAEIQERLTGKIEVVDTNETEPPRRSLFCWLPYFLTRKTMTST